MEQEDKITIEDKYGFCHEVIVKHYPLVGMSVAHYNDDIIASREYGRLTPPFGDDDREHEMFEERLYEWTSDAITDLEPDCKAYFNSKS